jgi:hypothetical protein
MSRQHQFILREIEEKNLDPKIPHVAGKVGLAPHPKAARSLGDSIKESNEKTPEVEEAKVELQAENTQASVNEDEASKEVVDTANLSTTSSDETEASTLTAVEDKPKKKIGKKTQA